MSAGYDPALFADAASEALSLPCFYLTTHRPNWLWDGRAGYPLMISYRTLRTVARPRPLTSPSWALDSGGFMELAQYGRWTISAREYITVVAEYDRVIGHLDWCPPQDWMCEPGVIHGGRVGHYTFPGTGLSEIEHQRRTIDSFWELTELWPQVSDHPECPVKPVLQGWEPKGYEKHAVMWEEAGVDLSEHEVVGIGSVCRRSSTRAIAEIAKVVGQMNISAHWFGVKLNGIRLGHLIETDRLQPDGDWMPAGTASLDSASWSYDARRGERLPGCTHVSPKTGEPSKCNNCPAYAAVWRERVLDALRAVYRSDKTTAGHNSMQPSGVLASAAASRGARPSPPRHADATTWRGDLARRIARPGLTPVRRAPGPALELELLPRGHRQARAAPGPNGCVLLRGSDSLAALASATAGMGHQRQPSAAAGSRPVLSIRAARRPLGLVELGSGLKLAAFPPGRAGRNACDANVAHAEPGGRDVSAVDAAAGAGHAGGQGRSEGGRAPLRHGDTRPGKPRVIQLGEPEAVDVRPAAAAGPPEQQRLDALPAGPQAHLTQLRASDKVLRRAVPWVQRRVGFQVGEHDVATHRPGSWEVTEAFG